MLRLHVAFKNKHLAKMSKFWNSFSVQSPPNRSFLTSKKPVIFKVQNRTRFITSLYSLWEKKKSVKRLFPFFRTLKCTQNPIKSAQLSSIVYIEQNISLNPDWLAARC